MKRLLATVMLLAGSACLLDPPVEGEGEGEGEEGEGEGEGEGEEGEGEGEGEGEVEACGNGVVDPGELCDGVGVDCAALDPLRSGTAPCRPDCLGHDLSPCEVLASAETEPNDSPADADPYAAGWVAAIDPPGDVDCVAVDAQAGEAIVGSTVAGPCDAAHDTVVEIYDVDGLSLLAEDDDGGSPPRCSRAEAVAPTAGVYFVCARALGDATFLYELVVEKPRCGNGAIEDREQCDGAALDGQSCASLGLSGNGLACNLLCQLDTSSCAPPTCGDGVRNGTEGCDGADFEGGDTCAERGYQSGALVCTPSCTTDTSACSLLPVCDDGQLGSAEECDGAQLAGRSCGDFGYPAGMLGCASPACRWDTSACPVCAPGDTLVTASSAGALAVPDGATVTSAAVVTASGTVQDAFVRIDALAHPATSELTIRLRPPGVGSPILLFDRRGTRDLDQTTFDDRCAATQGAGASPFRGCFSPQSPVAPLDGAVAAGTWTLEIVDPGDQTTCVCCDDYYCDSQCCTSTPTPGTLTRWTVGLCVR